MANPEDVGKLVAILSAAYPNWQANEYTAEVYYQDLADIDADLLFLAAKYCRTSLTRDQRFAPSAGEIRAAAAEIKRKAQAIPSALEAWDEVCTAHYREVSEERPFYRGGEKFTTDPDAHKWSHKLVEKVAFMMGWPVFPDPENESTDRAHFFKQYEAEVSRLSSDEIELPEVRRYIESHREALPIGDVVKQLKGNNILDTQN